MHALGDDANDVFELDCSERWARDQADQVLQLLYAELVPSEHLPIELVVIFGIIQGLLGGPLLLEEGHLPQNIFGGIAPLHLQDDLDDLRVIV